MAVGPLDRGRVVRDDRVDQFGYWDPWRPVDRDPAAVIPAVAADRGVADSDVALIQYPAAKFAGVSAHRAVVQGQPPHIADPTSAVR